MAIYGLQADIQQNPNRNIRLFVPGQTQLTATDVFLGGPGTGVTDKDLNGATRVYGNTAQDTSHALDEYTSDLASQIRSAVANNAAPRPDSYLGMPTMQRQQMEINQANSQIQNTQNEAQLTGMYNGKPTLQQKQFSHSVDQDKFNNGINLGQLMGSYGDQPTLAAKAQAIGDAQFYTKLAQDASQFGQKLSASAYDKYIKENKPSDTETLKMVNQFDDAISKGATVDDLLEDLAVWDEDGTAKLRKYDRNFLVNYLENIKNKQEQNAVPKTTLDFYQKFR